MYVIGRVAQAFGVLQVLGFQPGMPLYDTRSLPIRLDSRPGVPDVELLWH
jgi:hypothetical protein